MMNGMRRPFYLGSKNETIDNKGCKNLLQATPFSRKTEINFSNRISEEFFFDEFYSEMWELGSKIDNRRNVDFDTKVRESLLEIDNLDSKADFIHIWGYAGCGKTTYVHRLLWELGAKNQIEYSIVDFEITERAVQALKDTMYQIFEENTIGLYDFFYTLIDGRFFIMDAFGDKAIDYLKVFTNELGLRVDKERRGLYINTAELSKILDTVRKKIEGPGSEKCIANIEELNGPNSYKDFIEFLIMILFLYNIFEMLKKGIPEKNKSNIILFDNIDSLADRIEEYAVLISILEFRKNCILFFSQNLKNNNKYIDVVAKDFLSQIKFSFFMTSRVVTVKQLLAVKPDFEDFIGKPNHEMPEYFYDHEDIFRRRVDYYNRVEKNKNSKVLKKLNSLSQMKTMVYKSKSFRKLFNGNIRFCFSTIESLYDSYHDLPFIEDCRRLNRESARIREAGDGANGIVLSMLVDYMKNNGIFSNKLHLSMCEQDNKISLSRVVLTIIHEFGGSCSLLDIFDSLPHRYCNEELCNMIYDLSEIDREYWRRLLTFERIIPRNKEDLITQLQLFKKGEHNSHKYSRLNLCRSGKAYLHRVVPHFEFMLSRCNYPKGSLEDENYTPLFSSQSLEIVSLDKKDKNKKDYAFTLKIKRVFNTVSACVDNSKYFSDEVLQFFNYSVDELLNNSHLNYHDDEDDNPIAGNHQSYIGRLVFGHIGYIERYRRYLIKKQSMNVDINTKLTNFIKDYLELYMTGPSYVHSAEHDTISKAMFDQVDEIVRSEYKDYRTRIGS